jgi:hypothetical protein
MYGFFLAEGAYNPKEEQPKSASEELKWLRFGAENNVASAQVALGVKCLDGDAFRGNRPKPQDCFARQPLSQASGVNPIFPFILLNGFLGSNINQGKELIAITQKPRGGFGSRRTPVSQERSLPSVPHSFGDKACRRITARE